MTGHFELEGGMMLGVASEYVLCCLAVLAHILLAISIKITVDVDFRDADESSLFTLQALPIMLLEDVLDGPDRIDSPLCSQSQVVRLHFRHASFPLLPLLRYPLFSSEQHLFFLELFIYFIELIHLLLAAPTLHVQAALECLYFPFSLLGVLLLSGFLFRLVEGKLR